MLKSASSRLSRHLPLSLHNSGTTTNRNNNHHRSSIHRVPTVATLSTLTSSSSSSAVYISPSQHQQHYSFLSSPNHASSSSTTSTTTSSFNPFSFQQQKQQSSSFFSSSTVDDTITPSIHSSSSSRSSSSSSSPTITEQQFDDDSNNTKNTKNKRRYIWMGGSLLVLSLAAGYTHWYVECLSDYNEQVNHIYINHQSQFIQQAVSSALETLNSREHQTYLLNNVFNIKQQQDQQQQQQTFRIQNIQLSDIVSMMDHEGDSNQNQNSIMSDLIIQSDFKAQYSLLPDLCRMKLSPMIQCNGSKSQSQSHQQQQQNSDEQQEYRVIVEKCQTVIKSRECTLNFYFLIAPVPIPMIPQQQQAMKHVKSNDDQHAIVKVTMKSLDSPQQNLLFNSHDDNNDDQSSASVPDYYITRIAVCQTEKILPDLLSMRASSLQHGGAHKNHHWTSSQSLASSSPIQWKLSMAAENSQEVDEKNYVQQKLRDGGELVLEKASSIGGMTLGTSGIRQICHSYCPHKNTSATPL